MWDKIRIKSVKSYRSDRKSKKKDRTEVILDMPTKIYSEFRKQIEIPHLRDRRHTDLWREN